MRQAGGVAAVLALLLFAAGGRPQGRGASRVRLEAERAVLEYDEGDLDASEAKAFLKLADRGVADVEALVAPGLPDWARRRGPIRFAVSSRIPISRTRGDTVALPLARVQSRSAPYLHETAGDGTDRRVLEAGVAAGDRGGEARERPAFAGSLSQRPDVTSTAGPPRKRECRSR